MRTIGMSDYTVGENCFDELPAALAEYGAKKVAIIGGKRALAAALPGIEAALAGTDVDILETRVYGTNSTRANIAKVVNSPACQEADVLIACGGGKALDTVKTAAIELKKIVFTVPTICSNCSAATAIAVVYNDDGSLEGYSYPNRPAHIFINPKIIAEAPAEYFWAGVGDALSKQPEVEYATSAGNWSTPPVLAWHSPTPAPSRCLPMVCRVLRMCARICRARPSSRSRSTSLSTRAMSRT
ncbi:MAG: iron-containing alcohol dehydrogenase [Collinsella sp.]